MLDIVPLVEDGSLMVTEAGCEIRLRLKWYRSLPLSCIEKLELSIDRMPVPPEMMRLGINEHSYRMDELADLVEEFWFVQDTAVLSIQPAKEVTRGETHQLDLVLALRFPYIPVGNGRFLTHFNHYSAAQVAH
ncbi:MAG: hypothetical protein H6667_09670 [Ardenticatenaceae bacterium]|nr:hypothetical protein [Ardenticatenaceae bacterium]MCB9443438.1 hypothetical protein [Ardenticatenaceae bacterium]